MKEFSEYEQNVYLLNTIVKSTSIILPFIEMDEELTENIEVTMSMVLEFLSKQVKELPLIVVSHQNPSSIVSNLAENAKIVSDNWQAIPRQKELFLNSWDEFVFWWQEYLRKFKNSMNLLNPERVLYN